MLSPPTPPDEEERIRVLNSLNLLDTQADPELDSITAAAAALFDVPTVLVSLVDNNRQWFKSKIGFDQADTNRNISFCGHTILNNDITLVTDTTSDVRFYDNPLVTGEPFIRFYAGIPLTILGHNIGTLCILDIKPRSFSQGELSSLRDLAKQIITVFSAYLDKRDL